MTNIRLNRVLFGVGRTSYTVAYTDTQLLLFINDIDITNDWDLKLNLKFKSILNYGFII